jgi:hypothetical protein
MKLVDFWSTYFRKGQLPSEVEAFFGLAGLLYYFRALEEG